MYRALGGRPGRPADLLQASACAVGGSAKVARAAFVPLCFIVFLSSFISLLVAADGPAKPIDTSPDPLKDHTIVRCLFREGRLVLRYQGKLFVLRQGDTLPGSHLVVKDVNSEQMVLQEGTTIRKSGGKTVAVPTTIVIISQQASGKPEVRVFSDSAGDEGVTSPLAGASAGPIRATAVQPVKSSEAPKDSTEAPIQKKEATP